jgi:competence protein ComEC
LDVADFWRLNRLGPAGKHFALSPAFAVPVKRPLLPVALCYASGVVLGEWAHPPPAWLFGAGFAVAFAALAWKGGRGWLLWGLLALAGWANMERHTALVAPRDLRAVLGAAPEDVKLRGVICDSPAPRIFERGAKEFWHTSALVRAAEIWRGDHWAPAFGKVVAGTSGILDSNFFDGRSVEISGIIRPVRGALADGLFDPRRYYQRQEVYFQLQADSTNDWLALGPAAEGPMSERFSRWARRTLALGLPEEDEAVRLMWTLALDWKAPLTESVEEPFMRAGTFHIFAVDGLRIGLLAGILIGLLRGLRLPRAVCGLLAVPVIWFYAGLTGWPASAVRAAVMMSIVIGGWAAKRPGDLTNSLFAAALVILVWDPQQLFQAGFQLSFLIVLSIGLLALPMRRILYARLFPLEELAPGAVLPAWRVWMDAARRRGIDMFVMSLAAFLGGLPLAAYYFHLFTPAGVPANMAVVPLTGLALMSCMGSLLTGGWFAGLAVLFNHSGWFWMKCIIAASQWCARWPAGNWYVAAPRPMTFVLYYSALLAVFTGWIFRVRRKWPAAAGLALIGALWAADWQGQRGAARLDVLALRGAPAVFAGGWGTNRELLADCGDAAGAEGIVKPFLHAQGVNRLDDFCLTAGYERSAGGAAIVLTNFAPAAVFAGPARARSAAYRGVMAALERRPGLVRTAQDGDAVDGWAVLYPGAEDDFAAADQVSLALQRSVHGHSVLLLSALGRDGQKLLMARHPELRAEIVVAGLPARDEPLDEPLLDLLQPKLVIIADSELPATRRAPEKLRERLARRGGARVLYCHDAGSVTLLIRREGWQVLDTEGTCLSEAWER